MVHRSSLAPPSTEDEQADAAVRRGRNAGGPWIVASVIAFGIGLVAGSAGWFALTWAIGSVLFAIGMTVRARYWRAARRRLGDATIQRALWRSTEDEHDRSDRVIAALAIVLLILSFQLWKR